MTEIIIAATDTAPLACLTINGVNHSKPVGVAFVPTAAELAALQQSHFADDVAMAALRNLTVPTITGTAQDGQTLTGHSGTYNNTPIDYTYQWYADGEAIDGATEITCVLAVGQVDTVITFTETARDEVGTAVGTSAATDAVIAAGGGGPTALAVADFKNGVYSIGGVSKTLDETIENNPDFGGGYAPSDVVAGTGLVNSQTDGANRLFSAKLTSAAASLVSASGCIVVVTIVGTCPVTPDVRAFLNIGITDLPDNTEVWEVSATLQRDGSGDPQDFGVYVDDYDSSFGETPLTQGTHKFAAWLGQPELAVSVDGNPNAVGGATPQSNAGRNGVTITLNVTSNTGVTVGMVVEKLEFLPLAGHTASDLPTLSA